MVRIIVSLLVLLLLFSFANSAVVVLNKESSYPYNVSTNDTIIIDEDSSTVSSIDIGSSVGALLLGYGDRDILITGYNSAGLDYDTILIGSGVDDAYGIWFSGSSSSPCNNITLRHLVIKFVGDTISDTAADCIRHTFGYDINIDSVTLIGGGNGGHCFDDQQGGATAPYPGNWNVTLHAVKFYQNSTYYGRRDHYDGAAGRFGGMYYLDTLGTFNYHFKMSSCSLFVTHGQGFTFGARADNSPDYAPGVVKFYDNYLVGDAVNSKTWDGNFDGSSANPYLCIFSRLGAGSEIYNNSLYADSSYQGCRGMDFETCRGSYSIPIEIYNNTFTLHQGPDEEDSNGNLQIIRMRWGNRHLWFHDNTVNGTCDDDISTTYRGIGGYCIRWSEVIADNEGKDPGDSVRIYNNQFIMTNYGTNSAGYSAVWETDDTASWYDASETKYWIEQTTYSYGNLYESNYIPISMGGSNGHARGFLMDSDTLSFGTYGLKANPYTIRMSSQSGIGWMSDNDTLRNCVYLNGCSESDVYWATTTGGDLVFQRDLYIKVKNSDNSWMANALLTVTDNRDTVWASELTDSTGGATLPPVTYRYDGQSVDTTDYNDYTIVASKLGLADTSVLTISSTLAEDTLIIPFDNRISILFVHYSVGTQMIEGDCWVDTYDSNIVFTLDTLTCTDLDESDTARIVFHSYRMNDEGLGSPLSDSIPGSGNNGCAFDRFNGFEYDLYSGGQNGRVSIWESDEGSYPWGNAPYAGILDYFFYRPNWEDSLFGRIFATTHNIPSNFVDSVEEVNGYDLVIIKNPYRCWMGMTDQKRDSIKVLFQALVDTVQGFPNINFGMAFGTPLIVGHATDDSSMAHISYELYKWWLDTLVTPTNIFKIDTYGDLCELTNNSYKYGLKNEYWSGDGSHLNHAGETAVRQSFVDGIKNAVDSIMEHRLGGSSNVSSITNQPFSLPIDSIHFDYSGEDDSVIVSIITSSDIGYDSVFLAWSLLWNPDSLRGSGFSGWAYSPNTKYSDTLTGNAPEPYTIYVSGWQWDINTGWSERLEDSRTFMSNSKDMKYFKVRK